MDFKTQLAVKETLHSGIKRYVGRLNGHFGPFGHTSPYAAAIESAVASVRIRTRL